MIKKFIKSFYVSLYIFLILLRINQIAQPENTDYSVDGRRITDEAVPVITTMGSTPHCFNVTMIFLITVV